MGREWKTTQKIEGVDKAIARTKLGRFFKLEARQTSFTRELRAATATFLTMAYIISVNATILADSGGPCSKPDDTNADYQNCLSRLKSDLIVATSLSSMIGSLAMGLFANLPLGLAPGMGANVYVAYNLVGFHGSGPIPYKTVMAVVLLEGVAFLVIAVFGLRAKLARLIPRSVRLACAAGIGLFIAFVGLQGHQGVGLVGPDSSTLVTLSACAVTDPASGECIRGKMESPTFWLGFVGFLIMCYGLMKNIKGSMIYGMLFVTLISWIRGTRVTIFPHTPIGDSSYDYFKNVVDFHKIESTLWPISFTNFNTSQVWVALITLLYADVLATTGTLYTLAEIGGFVNEEGGFEGEYVAYMVDAGATIVGSAVGVSPMATYVESTAGIKEGGRTGLTAVIVGMYFGLSIFLTPVLTSVPPWAVGPSLVMVGVMMTRAVMRDIDWENVREAVPAFVTMILMPLTYSISNGIIGGIGVYVCLGLYDDYVVVWINWVIKMKRVVLREENQVFTTTVDHNNLEII